ncbi:hypothetical protein QCA50_013635 [Cerrena zonata]|uniref:Uncharacterized protein n=1 Tax=Cerrena zonata TaxID=2478898 RepID=A0AAW0G0E1_9APHY
MKRGACNRRPFWELPSFTGIEGTVADPLTTWIVFDPNSNDVETINMDDDSDFDTESIPDLAEDFDVMHSDPTTEYPDSDLDGLPELEYVDDDIDHSLFLGYPSSERASQTLFDFEHPATVGYLDMEQSADGFDSSLVLGYPEDDPDDPFLPMHSSLNVDPQALSVYHEPGVIPSLFDNNPVFGVDGSSTLPDVISRDYLNSMDILSFRLNESGDMWAADAVSDAIALLERGEFGTIERQGRGVLHIHLHLYLHNYLYET